MLSYRLFLFVILLLLFSGSAFANGAPDAPGSATPASPAPIPVPTVGRTVLARIRDSYGKIKDLPMIVTDVHSDTCISGVVLSAYGCEGLHAGGTLPLTSLCYSEESNVDSWHWIDAQPQGGDLASRIELLEDDFAALGESVNNIALTLTMKAPVLAHNSPTA